MLESLSTWRTPLTLTFFWNLKESCDNSEVAASIRKFEKHLDASNHSAKELIHFLRMFLLPAGGKEVEQVVCSIVFDGTKDDFIKLFTNGFRDALLEVLKNVDCSSAGNNGSVDLQTECALASWMLSNNCDPTTYHVGSVWNSVSKIKSDHEVYSEISSYLDSHDDLDEHPPQRIKELIMEMVKVRFPNIGSTSNKTNSLKVRRYLDGVLFSLLLLLIPLVPAILIAVAMKWAFASLIWLVPAVAVVLAMGLAAFIRCLEYAEKDIPMWPDDAHLELIVANENTGLQNQMTLVVDVKMSLARRLIISIVLWIADAVSRQWYTRGKLVGIDTIHFARFFLLQGKKRMLFMSDYDGSWGRYLFDFTGVGALAVVPIWSSLEGCPKARFLRWPATGFEERFLPFTRCRQIEVQCWYSGYPQLTVSEIKRNEKIRAGLFKQSSDSEILNWLSLFGGAE